MPGTNDFMHLSLPVKKDGQWKYPQTPVPGKETTTQNKSNRSGHRQAIRTQAQRLSRFWQERQAARSTQPLPTIAGGVPFLLEIEPTTDVEFLRGLGFEVVCDLDEGFIVVSSEQTNLADFLQKVDGFVDNVRGTGNVAKVYAGIVKNSYSEFYHKATFVKGAYLPMEIFSPHVLAKKYNRLLLDNAP